MSHPCPVTSIKYCVNVYNKINFARFSKDRESKISKPMKKEADMKLKSHCRWPNE